MRKTRENVKKERAGKKERQPRKGGLNGLVQFVILFKVFFTAILTSLFLRLYERVQHGYHIGGKE